MAATLGVTGPQRLVLRIVGPLPGNLGRPARPGPPRPSEHAHRRPAAARRAALLVRRAIRGTGAAPRFGLSAHGRRLDVATAGTVESAGAVLSTLPPRRPGSRTRHAARARRRACGAPQGGAGASEADALREPTPPRLADEARWYTEHTALLVSTLKWSLLGARRRASAWAGARAPSSGRSPHPLRLVERRLRAGSSPTSCCPLALPACVWLIRTLRAHRQGHGTEAVIAAVHQRSGKVDWLVAPGQARRDGAHARLRRLGRQGGPVRPDRRRDHQPVRGRAAAQRRGPPPPGDLRHRRRLRGGVRDAGVRRALRDRGPLPRPHRVPAALPVPGGRDRGPPRLRRRAPRARAPRGPSSASGRARSSARRSCSGPSSVWWRWC